jgi:hypothetical protein
MATFTVSAGTDWLATMIFGSVNDRWRLDDYDITMHVKKAGDSTVLLDLTTANGKLVISDPIARRLEVNVGWSEIETIEPGPFQFDVLFDNKVTDIRSRSGPHTLSITPAITLVEA